MREKLYQDWKRLRSDRKPPHGFSQDVMRKIHEIEATKSKTILGISEAEFILPAHRFVRWALMIGLGALGLFRISYVAISIFVP